MPRPISREAQPEPVSREAQPIAPTSTWCSGPETSVGRRLPSLPTVGERAGVSSAVDKVCISTPTKGQIHVAVSDWRLRAFARLAPNVVVQSVVTHRPLCHARNEQVLRFLATDCTHIFLLDSDCVPQEQAIQKLLAYDLPIVSSPHPSIVKGELGLMVLDRNPDGEGYVQHRPMTGLQRVDAVGGAGLLITRGVLEKIGSPWFMFLYDERGLLVKSGDFYFCEKAVRAGYEIWAQCDLAQVHLSEVPIQWPM